MFVKRTQTNVANATIAFPLAFLHMLVTYLTSAVVPVLGVPTILAQASVADILQITDGLATSLALA